MSILSASGPEGIHLGGFSVHAAVIFACLKNVTLNSSAIKPFCHKMTSVLMHVKMVIAHPTPATASMGRFADSTNCIVSNTEARLSFAVAITERKAA
jgi:hypothetical protein